MDDHFRRDVLVGLLEEQAEEQALGYSFLIEDDLEPLHVVGDEFDELSSGHSLLRAILDGLEDERDVEVDVVLVDVLANQVFLQFLSEVSPRWIGVDMPDDEQQLVVVGGIHVGGERLQGEVEHLLREVVLETMH